MAEDREKYDRNAPDRVDLEEEEGQDPDVEAHRLHVERESLDREAIDREAIDRESAERFSTDRESIE